MILSLVFFAGVGWTKLEAVGNQLEHVTATVQSMTTGGERLARIETRLDQIARDIDKLQQHNAVEDSKR